MNQLNSIYQSMLKSWGVSFTPDHELILNMAGQEVPVKVEDKQVYLPTNDNLNGVTIGKVFFHPACESVMSKETEIFKVIRKLTCARIYQVFQPIAQVLFAVAGKKTGKTTSGKMLEKLEPFKNASKEVKEDVLTLIKGIGITLEGTGIDNRLINWNLIKGGKDDQDRHVYYTAIPDYPYYLELCRVVAQNDHVKQTGRLNFNNSNVSKAAMELVIYLFEMVFPSCLDNTIASYSVVSPDAARLTAYLHSYGLVVSELNSLISKFRKDFDTIGIYGIELDWLTELDSLGEYKGLIPPLDYNNYNVTTSGDNVGSRAPSKAVTTFNLFGNSSAQQNQQQQTNAAVKQPNAPAARPGEHYMGCDYTESNGVFEFKFQMPGGLIRSVSVTEDNRIINEIVINPAMNAMNGLSNTPLGGMNDPRLLMALAQMQNNGIPPLMGMGMSSGGGFVRDPYTGQMVPTGGYNSYNNNGYNSAPLGTNDAWGNNSNQYQPMDAYTATGAGGTVGVNNF